MEIVKKIGIAIYILLLIYFAGLGIERAANDKMLITFALPAAVVLLLAVRVLGKPAELAGWSVFTIWLGSTYLFSSDNPTIIEGVAFAVYIGLALLGSFKSPYFLAAAWLLHPVWDFFPRALPDLLKDLPTACILFDIPIGLYLLWFARDNRWQVFSFAKSANAQHQ